MLKNRRIALLKEINALRKDFLRARGLLDKIRDISRNYPKMSQVDRSKSFEQILNLLKNEHSIAFTERLRWSKFDSEERAFDKNLKKVEGQDDTK